MSDVWASLQTTLFNMYDAISAGGGATLTTATITAVDTPGSTIDCDIAAGPLVGTSLSGVPCLFTPVDDDVDTDTSLIGSGTLGSGYYCLGPAPFDERRMLVTDWTGSYVPP